MTTSAFILMSIAVITVATLMIYFLAKIKKKK
jgi:hypothetical protein